MLHMAAQLVILSSAITLPADPPAETVPSALLKDKKPRATEAENLSFYRKQEEIIKNGILLDRALKVHPDVFTAIPPDGRKKPVTWLQKHLHVEIDVKKHELRISLPTGIKPHQQAAADAIALEFLKGLHPFDEEAKRIIKNVDSMVRAQASVEEILKVYLPIPPDQRTEKIKQRIASLQEDWAKMERHIQESLDKLVPEQQLMLFKARK